MFHFVFTSNVSDSLDKEFLVNLYEKVKSRGYCSKDSKCIFLCDLKIREDDKFICEKAKSISDAATLLVPTWIGLDDNIKQEIKLAQKQGIKIKLFSHWNKDDLEEVYSFFKTTKDSIFLWNEKIFFNY